LFFIFIRVLLFLSNTTRKSILLYILFSAPGLLIQFWFERIGRPVYGSEPGELRRAGEDLEAKGLTEFLWDILYWTYGCVLFAAVIGDRAWWLFVRRRENKYPILVLTAAVACRSSVLSILGIYHLYRSKAEHGRTGRLG
jgi:hypothetical protein